MNKQQIVKKLKEKLKIYKLKSISEDSGVSRFTLWRVLNNKFNPSYETLEKLTQYLEK
jgi:DNA-binding phage protein